ncbi:Transposase IS66 family [Shewanella psychrophila]|uniref:Transposase IS66 family n=1 Tax=Shewanella psychrophila TaxID=225848 RepID=A0A1S6HM87_9GAMM|nr:transposase [Shewanella psychrophila]AQS36624.1 Transposase IS66 family [Shewanella psychrophila]
MSQPFTDIDSKALEALIARVTEAKDNHLALSASDCQLLLNALVTLSTMQSRLANHDVTVHKLRKLLGIEKSSEGLGKLLKKSKAEQQRKKKKGPSSKGEDFTPTKPKVVMHSHADLAKGALCPECQIGRMYKREPGSLLRITGQSPFTPEQHVMERLRCNACGAYATAPLPAEVLSDGDSNQKYGYSARALMAIYKYFAGLPFYRQGSIQKLLGVNITASTVFDQVEYVANDIYPVYQALVNLAADAVHYYLDDTTHRILDAKPIEKKARNSDKMKSRCGVYTSGIIATTLEHHSIVLFETNIGHAGEFIDSILQHRHKNSPKPIIMSDALSSNRPTVRVVIGSLCNSHARRQFVDVITHFPDEVEHILTRYAEIWVNDAHTLEQQMLPSARQAYHQQHSLPIMEEIKLWGEEHLSSGKVESNSSLGCALRYFIKHYEGLSCFCTFDGVKLDNNLIEAMLKIIVRDRKNAMFHKTLHGATIGDIITSMIASASEAGINVFEYFTTLQREKVQVRANPERYLPWNYLDQPGSLVN